MTAKKRKTVHELYAGKKVCVSFWIDIKDHGWLLDAAKSECRPKSTLAHYATLEYLRGKYPKKEVAQ